MTYSPRKAIKVKCMDCCCGQLVEVQKCTSLKCALWPFRWGKVDFKGAEFPPLFWPQKRESTLTEAQRKEIGRRLHAHKAKK
jgi:hypothetical protein